MSRINQSTTSTNCKEKTEYVSDTGLGKLAKTGRIVRVRTCVGCRKQDEARNLLRVVCCDGVFIVDIAKALPGRGVWVHAIERCVANGITRKAFARGLRVDVKTDTKTLENRFKEIMDTQK